MSDNRSNPAKMAVLALLLGVGVIGCGTVQASSEGAVVPASTSAAPTASSPESPIALPSASVMDLSDTLVSDPGLGAKFSPPLGAVPAIDANTAWLTYQKTTPRPELIGQPFNLLLANYSNNVQGPVPSVDTKASGDYSTPRLSWIVMYRNIAPSARQLINPARPVPSSSASSALIVHPQHDCDFEAVIDATTGEYLGSFSECGSALVAVSSPSNP